MRQMYSVNIFTDMIDIQQPWHPIYLLKRFVFFYGLSYRWAWHFQKRGCQHFHTVDRVSKKLNISEYDKTFSEHFCSNFEKFLLKINFIIFQNGGDMRPDIYVVKTRIFCPVCLVKFQTSAYFLYINIRFFY